MSTATNKLSSRTEDVINKLALGTFKPHVTVKWIIDKKALLSSKPNDTLMSPLFFIPLELFAEETKKGNGIKVPYDEEVYNEKFDEPFDESLGKVCGSLFSCSAENVEENISELKFTSKDKESNGIVSYLTFTPYYHNFSEDIDYVSIKLFVRDKRNRVFKAENTNTKHQVWKEDVPLNVRIRVSLLDQETGRIIIQRTTSKNGHELCTGTGIGFMYFAKRHDVLHHSCGPSKKHNTHKDDGKENVCFIVDISRHEPDSRNDNNNANDVSVQKTDECNDTLIQKTEINTNANSVSVNHAYRDRCFIKGCDIPHFATLHYDLVKIFNALNPDIYNLNHEIGFSSNNRWQFAIQEAPFDLIIKPIYTTNKSVEVGNIYYKTVPYFQEIKAHKLIIAARSKVIAELLLRQEKCNPLVNTRDSPLMSSTDASLRDTAVLELFDLEDPSRRSGFEFIHYLYTDTFSESFLDTVAMSNERKFCGHCELGREEQINASMFVLTLVDMVNLAHKYHCFPMMLECERLILAKAPLKLLAGTLFTLAKKHRLYRLSDAIVKLVAKEPHEVCHSQDWLTNVASDAKMNIALTQRLALTSRVR